MKNQSERPVLITDAARSQADQYRSRQVRYGIMMGARTACLILGAILVSVHAPFLPVWLILCGIGMVFLPWIAVLIANDRPPRSKEERAASYAAREQAHQVALEQHVDPEPDHITIDADGWAPATEPKPEPERHAS